MRNHLKIMVRVRTIHYCNVCDYKTNRKYDKDKHVTRMHGSNIQKNLNQASSNIQNQHNTQYGNGQNTHHNGDYNKVVGIVQELKDKYAGQVKVVCEFFFILDCGCLG